jgi:N-acetylglucosaminyldiphosphoundecaprenol N-acetyl-beta-D-mannosaminyltransferase
MPQLPEKQRVVAVGISKTSYSEVVELCRSWAQERKTTPISRARYICVTSVHGIIMAQDDSSVARYINEADIATPDGMPVVWALRSFGENKQQRVYGPTLMLEICRSAEIHGDRIFLYGGREDTLPVLCEKLIDRFPKLQIAGSHSPPFRLATKEEDQEICRSIADSQADIVFVGISTPKQEKWMYEHRDRFPGVTMIGVGAAFDFHAGRTRQAPSWMQRNGLEWLFRLSSEPSRLWRRYLLITPRFIPLWARQRLLEIRRATSAL